MILVIFSELENYTTLVTLKSTEISLRNTESFLTKEIEKIKFSF